MMGFGKPVTPASNMTSFLGIHVSNEKNLGWLGYIGDYTAQLYRDYNKPL